MKISREKKRNILRKVNESMDTIESEVRTIEKNKRDKELITRRLWNIECELNKVSMAFDMLEELNIDMGTDSLYFNRNKFAEGVYSKLVKIINSDIMAILKNEMIFTKLEIWYEEQEYEAAQRRLEEKRNNTYEDDKYYSVEYKDFADDMYGNSHMIVEEDIMTGKRLKTLPKDFIISVEDVPKEELEEWKKECIL